MLFVLEHGNSGSELRFYTSSNHCARLLINQMLDRLSLVDAVRNRQYLLDKTQHLVGGFGKGVGEPPGMFPYPLFCTDYGPSDKTRPSTLLFRLGVASL